MSPHATDSFTGFAAVESIYLLYLAKSPRPLSNGVENGKALLPLCVTLIPYPPHSPRLRPWLPGNRLWTGDRMPPGNLCRGDFAD